VGVASLKADPVMEWVYYWAEADPLTRYLPEHDDNMDAIDRLLPKTVALVGSDYRARHLNQQVEQGREAARRIVSAL
jgi:protoporphyrinogen oxidase